MSNHTPRDFAERLRLCSANLRRALAQCDDDQIAKHIAASVAAGAGKILREASSIVGSEYLDPILAEGADKSELDITSETLLLPTQAAKHAPTRPHPSTIVRWMLSGIAGGLKLESVKVGGRRYTSCEAMERFAERCTNPDADTSSRSARQRTAVAHKAGDELAAAGV